MIYHFLFFAIFWLSYFTFEFDFRLKIGKGLSKAGNSYSELKHVAREKEHSVPWL